MTTFGEPSRSGLLAPSLIFAMSGVALVFTAWVVGRGDVALACAAGSAVVAGAISAIESIRRLSSGLFGVDVLATIAIAAALFSGEVWAAFVVGLMLASGETLERYANWRARKDLRQLISSTPTHAFIERVDGTSEEVRIADVHVGDTVLARQGEVVPVDCVLLDDAITLDQTSLTGESLPQQVTRNQPVASGAINLSGLTRMRAVREEADSQYQRIVALATQAANQKAPMVRLADKVAGPFTLLALAISLVSGFWSGEWARSVAVLVVATPCPLIIAAPVAFAGGISRAAREKIVVRSGAALELLARSRTIAFDKTGTLTRGMVSVANVVCSSSLTPERLLALAAAADSVSSHVYAAALRQAAPIHLLPTIAREDPGLGVEAVVDGHKITLGSERFVRRDLSQQENNPEIADGNSVIYVRVDGGGVDKIVLADSPRPNARAVINVLTQKMGQHVLMLSGDARDAAQRIAEEVGIDMVHAPCSPAQKVAILGMQSGRPVVMVGDGINDAPVLASADVGIVMGGSRATLASEAADIVLLSDDLADVPRARQHARHTVRVARQSILLGISLSVILMLIAAAGMLPALAGAWLQELVDVATILWSLRAATASHEGTGSLMTASSSPLTQPQPSGRR